MGVCLQWVFIHSGCLFTVVWTDGGSLFTVGVHLHWVSDYGWCLLTVGVYLQWVSIDSGCPFTLGVYLQWVSIHSWCLFTVGVHLQWVPIYSGNLFRVGVYLHLVLNDSRCSSTVGVAMTCNDAQSNIFAFNYHSYVQFAVGVAMTVNEAQADILVEMVGWYPEHRASIVAHRPTRVQVRNENV